MPHGCSLSQRKTTDPVKRRLQEGAETGSVYNKTGNPIMKRKNSFTLIELLVTIVIISIIVGITVPAFTRLMTGSAVTHAISMVTSQLNMARTEACSSRKYVAVVFLAHDMAIDPDSGNSWDEELLAGRIYNRRAFRSCYVNKDVNAPEVKYIFAGWVNGTRWEVLPQGAYIHFQEKSSQPNGWHLAGWQDATEVLNVSDDTRGVDMSYGYSTRGSIFQAATDCDAIIFQPNGKAVTTSDERPQVVIREGVVESNAGTEILRANNDNEATIYVNRFTGAITTVVTEP
jgi:prepilin-type N-terminal cleavage/methylation domain-containing protein